jgi:hypothetical protein
MTLIASVFALAVLGTGVAGANSHHHSASCGHRHDCSRWRLFEAV